MGCRNPWVGPGETFDCDVKAFNLVFLPVSSYRTRDHLVNLTSRISEKIVPCFRGKTGEDDRVDKSLCPLTDLGRELPMP